MNDIANNIVTAATAIKTIVEDTLAKLKMPTIGGGTDTWSRAITIMIYVIVGLFLFTLVCDLCSEGQEFFTSFNKSGITLEYYKKTGCPWCVKFDNSGVLSQIDQKYSDVITIKIYDIANPADREFIPQDARFPSFKLFANGKFVSDFPSNADRTLPVMSAWIDDALAKNKK